MVLSASKSISNTKMAVSQMSSAFAMLHVNAR